MEIESTNPVQLNPVPPEPLAAIEMERMEETSISSPLDEAAPLPEEQGGNIDLFA